MLSKSTNQSILNLECGLCKWEHVCFHQKYICQHTRPIHATKSNYKPVPSLYESSRTLLAFCKDNEKIQMSWFSLYNTVLKFSNVHMTYGCIKHTWSESEVLRLFKDRYAWNNKQIVLDFINVISLDCHTLLTCF